MPLKDAPYQVSIQIFQQFENLVSEEWLRKLTQDTLVTAPTPQGTDRPSTIDVVIVDNDTIRDLNKRFRGLDEITDVLSFSFGHQGEYYGHGESPSQWSEDGTFAVPPGEGAGLGEVIISYPQAVRQAEESGHTPDLELALLLAHGVLHLLGFDHAKPAEDAAMKAIEAKVLAQVLDHD